MRRREFITIIGGAAVWPLAAGAQPTTMPVVGFLRNASADGSRSLVAGFQDGLKDNGYTEGRNVVVEYRWGGNKKDQLPTLMTDLANHHVAVIVAGGNDVAIAAKNTSTKIPVVFAIGLDPVRLGLVASLNQPGGNMTGITFFHTALLAKRIELLHELVPKTGTMALLTDPNNSNSELEVEEAQAAAQVLGQQMQVLRVSSQNDLEPAFATFADHRVGGLIIGGSALFLSAREQLIALAARFAVPAISPWVEAVREGGLIAYATSITGAYRQVGTFTARILKGEKPADLPVEESTKVELIINQKTAKALGLTFSLALLGRADEVIE